MNDNTIIISIFCYVVNKNYNIINKVYNLCYVYQQCVDFTTNRIQAYYRQ